MQKSLLLHVSSCPVSLFCHYWEYKDILLVINQASLQSIVIIVIISPFLFFDFVVVVVFMVLFFVVLVVAVLFFVAVVHWTMSSSLHGWLPVEPGGQCWRVVLDLTFSSLDVFNTPAPSESLSTNEQPRTLMIMMFMRNWNNLFVLHQHHDHDNCWIWFVLVDHDYEDFKTHPPLN